jgi:hypothetical protein
MRVLNDFRCANGHTLEYFIDNLSTDTQCQKCPERAVKVQRPILSRLDPHDRAFPGAFMKWEKDREKRKVDEAKTSYHEPE